MNNDLMQFKVMQPSDTMSGNPAIDDYSLASGKPKKAPVKKSPAKKTAPKPKPKPVSAPKKPMTKKPSQANVGAGIAIGLITVTVIYLSYKLIRKKFFHGK